MVLFVSDIHFGRADAATEREKERDLIACLRAHDSADHLYLVGDVFDQYIEYPHLIPKGFARFQGLLAEWCDRGVPITYVAGNHDPWHRSYFAEEFGARIAYDGVIEPIEGRTVYVTHGDAVATTSSLYPHLRPWMRHPVCTALYRALLPADAGYRLARWVSRRLHTDSPDPKVVSGLREYARNWLANNDADALIMGHSHVAECTEGPKGTYCNLGNWYESRTFARLDEDGIHLLQWNGTRAVDIEAAQGP